MNLIKHKNPQAKLIYTIELNSTALKSLSNSSGLICKTNFQIYIYICRYNIYTPLWKEEFVDRPTYDWLNNYTKS